MSLIKKLREAREKYPDVDVCIRRDSLYIDRISEEEFTEKSLGSSHFLPRDQFVISDTLGEPPE